jgi:hypothetical protein
MEKRNVVTDKTPKCKNHPTLKSDKKTKLAKKAGNVDPRCIRDAKTLSELHDER